MTPEQAQQLVREKLNACGALNDERTVVCILPEGHEELHEWDSTCTDCGALHPHHCPRSEPDPEPEPETAE